MPSDTRIGVLVIHGIGSQLPDFADGLIADVSAVLGPLASRVTWKTIYWAPALEHRETPLSTIMTAARDPDGRPLGLDWSDTRHFVIHNFGDAVAYHRDRSPTSAGDIIHRIVSKAVDALNEDLADPSVPVVVFAHSLGGYIMSNYIWDRQHAGSHAEPLTPLPTLVGMVTFGCNIPLFSLAFAKAEPIDLPAAGVTDPRLAAAARWLNFFDRDDVLGWPLKPLYEKDAADLTDAQKHTVARIEDREIAVGGLATGWNPASHADYWTDQSFVQPAAAYLRELLGDP